ncbi:MAG: hypothetical protein ACAI44_29110 [Candidatus Sericytochromatia bacterium]
MRLAPRLLAALTCLLLLRPTPVSAAAAYDPVFADRSSSYILVFAYPSAAWLDWSSPSNLSRTSVQSTLAKRLFSLPTTIGHAQIAWSCRGADGTLLSSGASGQSGENNGQSLAALRTGWGMSILEMVFTDGELETAADVDSRIRKGVATNQFSWAGFKVPTENCLQMVDFIEHYQASGAFKNYGFPVDPLKFEGAGCTSYANAALERSGAPLPFRDAWVRSYQIPENQLGRNGEPPAHTAIVPQARIPQREHQIGLNEFLFGDQQWARPDEPGIRFQYYDPELFYESFLHLENDYRQAHGLPLRTATRTATLDAFQQKLKQTTDSWMQQLQQQKVPMQLAQILGDSGLIIDLRQARTDRNLTEISPQD